MWLSPNVDGGGQLESNSGVSSMGVCTLIAGDRASFAFCCLGDALEEALSGSGLGEVGPTFSMHIGDWGGVGSGEGGGGGGMGKVGVFILQP